MLFKETWDDGLEIRDLSPDEVEKLIKPVHGEIFNSSQPRTIPNKFYSTSETESLETLASKLGGFELSLGALYKGVFAGWHFGNQTSKDTYFMRNSAVLPEFRRLRIYERLLHSTLRIAKDVGFQRVTSNHHPSNTAVLIAKLKVGFWISGMTIDDRFGTLVNLVWFPNEVRRDAFEYRIGYKFPSDAVKKLLER